MTTRALRQIRGKDIAIIFQEPVSALNPLITIGTHMEEALLAHGYMGKAEARDRSVQLLTELDLPAPANVLKLYPFQLSGGQAQRVMIAMAMAWNPRVIIADEITSNLDVTLQADVIDRLKRLQRERHSAVMLITHDMGVIAQAAQEVAVMYAGAVVEYADTISIFRRPFHPVHVGASPIDSQAGQANAGAPANRGIISQPDRSAEPVPVPAAMPQGFQRVPAQPKAGAGGG